jgi:hypothetical protein
VNLAATLVDANKHFCRRRRLCQPSGEAKKRQQWTVQRSGDPVEDLSLIETHEELPEDQDPPFRLLPSMRARYVL